MGLPAIVGRRSGAAELLRQGENGWICEPDDVSQLAGLMHAAATTGNRLRAAARATAEGYGIDRMARKLTDLYAKLS
jgi:UDP-glucose:(heptosyl)LPS alpha-1,3-glucosyltransferase